MNNAGKEDKVKVFKIKLKAFFHDNFAETYGKLRSLLFSKL